jgi:histidinol phosphatase-like PHP family hydrolase
MPNNTLCTADLHTHTNRSICAPQSVTVASYLPACATEGIRTLGISNHVYKPTVLNVNYPDNISYALQVREEMRQLQPQTDVKLLLGCEVDIFYGQEPTVPVEDAPLFDYALIAASHIFNWAHEYAGIDLSTPEKIRRMLIDRFVYACELDYAIPVGICHPLYPLCTPNEQEIVDGFTYAELKDCFTLAAERKRSIEIHACLYRNSTQLNEDGLSPSYLRLLSVAKECGCQFHFGVDAHTPEAFVGYHQKLERAAQIVGITQDDLWHMVK